MAVGRLSSASKVGPTNAKRERPITGDTDKELAGTTTNVRQGKANEDVQPHQDVQTKVEDGHSKFSAFSAPQSGTAPSVDHDKLAGVNNPESSSMVAFYTMQEQIDSDESHPNLAATDIPVKRSVSRLSSKTSSKVKLTVTNMKHQSITSIPLPLDPTNSVKQMKRENRDIEKERARLQKTKQKKLLQPRRKQKQTEVTEDTYIPPSNYVQMLKTSMRFLPGMNPQPNVLGSPDDPPYLFKSPGREIAPRVSTSDLPMSENEDSTKQNEPIKAKPAFGLAWPSNESQPLIKAHQNMLSAFLAYYKRKADMEKLGWDTTFYDPSLSVSCAVAQGKQSFPKGFKTPIHLPVEIGIPYDQIPPPEFVESVPMKPKTPNAKFVPVGFVSKDMALQMALNDNFASSDYEMAEIAVFPDLGVTDIPGMPSAAKAVVMDAEGNVYEANPGDAVPTNGKVGYIDADGNFKSVMDVQKAMKEGHVGVVKGFGRRSEVVEARAHEAEVLGLEAHLGSDLEVKHGKTGLGNPVAHHNLYGTEYHNPGDVTSHQSQIFFVGVGQMRPHSVAPNHPEEEHLSDQDGKKNLVKKNRKKTITYVDEDGEMEVESIYDFEFDDTTESKIEVGGERGETFAKQGLGIEPGGVLSQQQSSTDEGYHKQSASTTTKVVPTGWTGKDLQDVAPPGSSIALGYLDVSGQFVEVQADESIPLNSKPVYMDKNTNVIGELEPTPKIPTLVEIERSGYLDENGDFVEVQSGEGVPDGVALGVVNEHGHFEKRKSTHGYIDNADHFVELRETESVPEDALEGFKDHQGNFRPKPAQMGYVKDGTFIELQSEDEIPPVGVLLGYIDTHGNFIEESKVPETAEFGFVQNGVFTKLNENEKPPPGVAVGYRTSDNNSAEIVPLRDPEKGFFNSNGEFQQSVPIVKKISKIPSNTKLGYSDDQGDFHQLQPGEKVPRGTEIGYMSDKGKFIKLSDGGGARKPVHLEEKPSFYVENPNEIVEVEIHDESDLDENGQPTVKMVLRHRGSVEAPKNAKPIEGGGLVWVDGEEEVTELPFLDKKDLDENGKPKFKRMRVRRPLDKTIGVSGGQQAIPTQINIKGRQHHGRGQRPKPGDPDYESYYPDYDEEDLREAPLTEEERLRLVEFQRHVQVQCDLDIIEGSLDLGEVVRKSFRIYSHGGSIDIEPTSEHREAPREKEMATQMSQTVLSTEDATQHGDKPKKRPPSYPGPH